MKKILIPFLTIIAIVGCKKHDQEKGSVPPYQITEHSEDSIIATITYEEYLKEKQKIDKYNLIVKGEEYTKEEKAKQSINAFSNLIKSKRLNHELEHLGIKVYKEEQTDFIQGKNIHPSIKKIPVFKNPETGKFDKSRIQPFIDNLSQNKQSEPYFVWNYQINQIRKTLKRKKYESLLSSSYFLTDIQTGFLKKLLENKSNINIAKLPYKTFHDSISLNNDDYKSFLDEHGYNYQIYERRYLKAANIPIKIHKHFHEKEFKTFERLIKTNESFERIAQMSPAIKGFSSYYYPEGIPEELKAFFKKAKPGDVFGPYYSKNSFRAIKFEKARTIPEKAIAHHLLIKNTTKNEVDNLKESLKKEVNKGKDFLTLAKEYASKHPEKTQWGDTEWFRHAEMEKAFSDSTFFNDPGDIVLAKTRYGWHIINIKEQGLKKKRYFFTGLFRPLEASKEDIEATKKEAENFAKELNNPDNFAKRAKEKHYIVQSYEGQALDINIYGLPNSADVLKWAFNTKKKSISKPFYINDKIYIFKVDEVGGPGTMPVHAAKKIIEGNVRTQKVKNYLKNQYNIEQYNALARKDAIEKLNMEQVTVSGITFAQSTLANFGTDPYVAGLAVTLNPGEETKILFGKNNLFTLKKLGEKYSASANNYIDNHRKGWQSIISNGDYRLVFRLHDGMRVNLKRKQDSYFLLPKYEDTLKDDPQLSSEMFRAEHAFRNGDYSKALNGDENFEGFKTLMKSPLSKQQRLATIYAGLSALQLDSYDKAIEYLNSVKTSDRFFSVIIYGVQADALSQQGKYKKALEMYKKAINSRDNFMLAPRYILKMLSIYDHFNDFESGLEAIHLIKDKYPQSSIIREIDKYLAYFEYKANRMNLIKKP